MKRSNDPRWDIYDDLMVLINQYRQEGRWEEHFIMCRVMTDIIHQIREEPLI